jgi:tRNA 2-thiocytidine biosynthesis protein TtcA
MLNDWERRYPGRIETMFRSLANVVPSHLLDARLFDFAGLAATGTPDPEGDVAFDPQALPAPQPVDFMELDD